MMNLKKMFFPGLCFIACLFGFSRSSMASMTLADRLLQRHTVACVTLRACVDGSDYFLVTGNMITHVHGAWSQVGTHGQCGSSAVPGGGYFIDDVRYPASSTVPIAISQLNTFTKISGRPTVSLASANRILISDGADSSATSVVKICQ